MPAQPYPPPRGWLVKPDVFGKGTGRPAWKQPGDEREARLIRAARYQHMLARKIRQHLQDEGTTVSAVAPDIGISADMINDALNGLTHLHVTTVDAIANVLGMRLTMIEFVSDGDLTSG